jgi:uncharacterized membrane protein YbhN (UPF0104 family)
MEESRRGIRGWLGPLGWLAGALVLAVVFIVVLPRIADPGDVWASLRELPWPWVLALLATAALNVITFAYPYMAAMPGLRFRTALAVTTASTASTYVAPGGMAVGIALSYAMLRGWGIRARDATLSITVVTIWNQFMIFGTPAIALAWLSASGGTNALLQTAAFAGVAVFAAIVAASVLGLSTSRLASAMGDAAATVTSRLLQIVRRPPVTWSGETLVDFRDSALGLLRARWHLITLGTLAGHLTVYIVLLVSVRALGITGSEVSLAESFAAWALARVLQQIAFTPGGFGFVELGLTGALVAFGGPNGEVVAAMLVYRFLTVAPPVVLGALFGATWRRHNPRLAERSAVEPLGH